MKITFLSNFYNHHQMPLSRSLNKHLNGDYSFIATIPMDSERKNMGYKEISESFVFQYDNDEDDCDYAINNADVVIYGSAPFNLIKKRLRKKKLVYQYSERIFKIKPPKYQMPLRAIKYWFYKGRFSNMYLLCASAFTYADYAQTKTFINRGYKWGYFPETKNYDLEDLLQKKEKTKILWVGRFLDWKHPDDAIKVAKLLKDSGYDFHLDMVGTGEMENTLKSMADSMNLNDYVTFTGPVQSDKVRGFMERAGIFLFTSDRQEGWGAVLNESMNSGCAVVASHAIGSVPFLMKNKANGLIYPSGKIEKMFEKVKYLLDNTDEQKRMGEAAYKTIVEKWNAEIAATRIIELSHKILNGEEYPDLYESGPCSKAEIVDDEWFET